MRIWDPETGQQRATLEGHQDWVCAVCPVTVAGKELLASAGDGGTVRIWDPETGQQRTSLEGHQGGVYSVCPVTVAGKGLLASAGSDGTVRIWDPRTGQQRTTLEGHQDGVWSVCPVTVAGREPLASAGTDGTVRHLGPPNRPTAHRAGRPPGWRLVGVPGHRRRPRASGQRGERRDGADLGPARPVSSVPRW